MCALTSEALFASASRSEDSAPAIVAYRTAGKVFPLSRRNRTGSAIYMLNIALRVEDKRWKAAAVAEAQAALRIDPTQADVMGMMIGCEMQLGRQDDAYRHLQAFKHIAPGSPLIRAMERDIAAAHGE